MPELTVRSWCGAKVAETLRHSGLQDSVESQSRRPAETPELQSDMRVGHDRAMTAPALQGMQQQPVEVVALGVRAPPYMGEPTMGHANNVVYPGRAVGAT